MFRKYITSKICQQIPSYQVNLYKTLSMSYIELYPAKWGGVGRLYISQKAEEMFVLKELTDITSFRVERELGTNV